MDRADRGREVLAQGVQRSEDPRCRRHPDRGGRRPEGFRRGDRSGVSGDDGADLHRAPDPQQPGLRDLEGSQILAKELRPIYKAATEAGAQAALEAFAAGSGRQVPDGRRVVAPRLGARDPVLRVSAGGAPRDLHDQRDREPAHAAAQDHQDARPLPERRCCHEVAVARAAQRDEQIGKIDTRVEERDESVRHPVRRSVHELTSVKPASHTEFLTRPRRRNVHTKRFCSAAWPHEGPQRHLARFPLAAPDRDLRW